MVLDEMELGHAPRTVTRPGADRPRHDPNWPRLRRASRDRAWTAAYRGDKSEAVVAPKSPDLPKPEVERF